MSEELILNGKHEEKSKELTLTITMSQETGFNVNGPGDGKFFDEPMCLWMLKKAERHIEMSNAMTHKKEQPIITNAGRIRGIFKGK